MWSVTATMLSRVSRLRLSSAAIAQLENLVPAVGKVCAFVPDRRIVGLDVRAVDVAAPQDVVRVVFGDQRVAVIDELLRARALAGHLRQPPERIVKQLRLERAGVEQVRKIAVARALNPLFDQPVLDIVEEHIGPVGGERRTQFRA